MYIAWICQIHLVLVLSTYVKTINTITCTILPGQQILLHTTSLVLLPVQGKPPHEGAVHVLVSILIPPPQVLLHDP